MSKSIENYLKYKEKYKLKDYFVQGLKPVDYYVVGMKTHDSNLLSHRQLATDVHLPWANKIGLCYILLCAIWISMQNVPMHILFSLQEDVAHILYVWFTEVSCRSLEEFGTRTWQLETDDKKWYQTHQTIPNTNAVNVL